MGGWESGPAAVTAAGDVDVCAGWDWGVCRWGLGRQGALYWFSFDRRSDCTWHESRHVVTRVFEHVTKDTAAVC